jgi:hypothetical protein
MQSVIDEKAVLQQRLEDAGTALDRSQAEAASAVQAQAAASAALAQVQAELEAAARDKAAAQAALSALQEEQGRTSASLTALQQEKGRVDAALGRLQRELAATREERASAVAALAGASMLMPSHGWQGLCVRWGCNAVVHPRSVELTFLLACVDPVVGRCRSNHLLVLLRPPPHTPPGSCHPAPQRWRGSVARVRRPNRQRHSPRPCATTRSGVRAPGQQRERGLWSQGRRQVGFGGRTLSTACAG